MCSLKLWSAEEIAMRLEGRRMGQGWLCRCPVAGHGRGLGDRHPSLSVTDGGQQLLIYCHAGCDMRDVLAALGGRGVEIEQGNRSQSRAAITPVEPNVLEPDQQALRLWNASVPAHGTVVETYLRRRGIGIPLPTSIRFGTARTDTNSSMPRMLVCVRGASGAIVAVQSTRLMWSGEKVSGALSRINTGAFGDGAARFAEPTRELGLAEGTETALAAMQLNGVPCWASLGAGRMHHVAIPSGIRELHIFADNDNAGQQAAYKTAECHVDIGRRVIVRFPPWPSKDWASVVTPSNPSSSKEAA